MPPFDRSGLGRRIRPFTDFAERSPLRRFGMALVVTARKPAAGPPAAAPAGAGTGGTGAGAP